jgi:hypothetical protein
MPRINARLKSRAAFSARLLALGWAQGWVPITLSLQELSAQ